MAVRAFITLLLVLLLFCLPASAQEPPELLEMRGAGIVVAYPERLEPEARKIIRMYPALREELEQKMGLSAGMEHAVVLVSDRETFLRAAGSGLIVAFANGSRGLIAVDYYSMLKRPHEFRDTLKHELCHLALHQYLSQGEKPAVLPRWLNEGICQWASAGVSELAGVGGRSELENAAVGNRFIPLYRLERTFPADERGLRLAYEQSQSAVEYIVSGYGYGKVLEILEHLRDGRDIDLAVRRSLGIGHSGFEDAWHASLRRRYTWITWLSGNLELVLFVFGAVVLVLAFIRAAWKMVTYKDDDDDIPPEHYEGIPPTPPPPGDSPAHRRLRSRKKGRHYQGEDDGPQGGD